MNDETMNGFSTQQHQRSQCRSRPTGLSGPSVSRSRERERKKKPTITGGRHNNTTPATREPKTPFLRKPKGNPGGVQENRTDIRIERRRRSYSAKKNPLDDIFTSANLPEHRTFISHLSILWDHTARLHGKSVLQ